MGQSGPRPRRTKSKAPHPRPNEQMVEERAERQTVDQAQITHSARPRASATIVIKAEGHLQGLSATAC